MVIRIEQNLDPSIWKVFLNNHPHNNIFQTVEMFEIYQKTNYYEPVIVTAVNEKNELLGILLTIIQKENGGWSGKFSARSIVWGGPIIKNNNLNILDTILKEYKKQIHGKAIYTEFRNLWDWPAVMHDIFLKNGFYFEEHLDVINDLKLGANLLFKNLKPQARQKIKKAETIPLLLKEIENLIDFEKCVNIIKDNYKRIKLPCADKSLFLESYNRLKNKNAFKAFAAIYQEKIIACRFVLCYNKIIYDWYAGADNSYLDKYPNDFLPWKIMEWGINNGYETFDFGGAGKPNVPYGVRDFKLKFGGKLVDYGRFILVHKPILMVIGRIGLKFYGYLNGLLK